MEVEVFYYIFSVCCRPKKAKIPAAEWMKLVNSFNSQDVCAADGVSGQTMEVVTQTIYGQKLLCV